MTDTADSRRVASRKRFRLARWVETHTSTTFPLLVSVVALGAAGVAVILAHRGRPAPTTAATAAAISVPSQSLLHGWKNVSPATDSSAGYYRTSDGRVFLTGTLEPKSGAVPQRSVVFVLPSDYRPSRAVTEPIATGHSRGTVSVLQSGEVVIHLPTKRPDVVSLDGVSFLAQSVRRLFVPQNLLNQYGWTSASTATEGRAGYYMAPDGRVYLAGTLRPLRRVARHSTAFVLPGGYRPARTIVEPIIVGRSFGTVAIQPTGGVVLDIPSTRPTSVSLDGVSFAPGL